MLFRYDETRRQAVRPETEVTEATPARLLLELVGLLDQWLGVTHRTLCRPWDCRLQVGYPDIELPTLDFGETFGAALARLDRDWPTQCFSAAENDELVGLRFVGGDDGLLLEQNTTSGSWYRQLQGLYLEVELPDAASAQCLTALLRAAEQEAASAALDWACRSFLEGQELSDTDPVFSFCYVTLQEGGDTPEARLRGLSLSQKQTLWYLFLKQEADPPEFEWVWSCLNEGTLSDWLEWSLALYQELEDLGYQFLARDGCFQLQSGSGERRYFGVDNHSAAERVLMKILYPLNR